MDCIVSRIDFNSGHTGIHADEAHNTVIDLLPVAPCRPIDLRHKFLPLVGFPFVDLALQLTLFRYDGREHHCLLATGHADLCTQNLNFAVSE